MLRFLRVILTLCAIAAQASCAQSVQVRLRYPQKARTGVPPAVVWLKPLQRADPPPALSHRTYTLLQKDRSFIPHLLVVPVGSEVHFPNEDPFYHNVFSLFDGKRFDLGLYEAGSTKTVTFSREGVSYIFCNIHPEMSAVVVALSTPFFATTDRDGAVELHNVPVGDYELHVWVEGVPQPELDRLTRRVRLTTGMTDLGVVTIPVMPVQEGRHLNKFGQPYDRNARTPY